VAPLNVVPPPPPGIAPAKVAALLAAALRVHGKLATIRQILKHGGYTLALHAPGAGELDIAWYLQRDKARKVFVAQATAEFRAARRRKVRIKLTGAGRSALGRATHLKLGAIGAFTSSDGTIASVARTFTLGG
jgi:hypothetical protein